MVSRSSKVDDFAYSLFFFFFCWLSLGLVFWLGLGDPCVCQSSIGVYVCHFLGQVLDCAYTICWCGQLSWSLKRFWETASLLRSLRLFTLPELISVLLVLNGQDFLYSDFLFVWSSSSKTFGIVPSVTITIDIIFILILYSFFTSLAKSQYMSIILISYSFTLLSAGTATFTRWHDVFFFVFCFFFRVFFFFFFYSKLGIVFWNLYLKLPENFMHRICLRLKSKTDSTFCRYLLLVWSNFNFLRNSPWIPFPTQSFLTLYSFVAFAYYVIYSLSRYYINLLSFVYYQFLFNIICPYGIVFAAISTDLVSP